jgi:hypothetical protein
VGHQFPKNTFIRHKAVNWLPVRINFRVADDTSSIRSTHIKIRFLLKIRKATRFQLFARRNLAPQFVEEVQAERSYELRPSLRHRAATSEDPRRVPAAMVISSAPIAS